MENQIDDFENEKPFVPDPKELFRTMTAEELGLPPGPTPFPWTFLHPDTGERIKFSIGGLAPGQEARNLLTGEVIGPAQTQPATDRQEMYTILGPDELQLPEGTKSIPFMLRDPKTGYIMDLDIGGMAASDFKGELTIEEVLAALSSARSEQSVNIPDTTYRKIDDVFRDAARQSLEDQEQLISTFMKKN